MRSTQLVGLSFSFSSSCDYSTRILINHEMIMTTLPEIHHAVQEGKHGGRKLMFHQGLDLLSSAGWLG